MICSSLHLFLHLVCTPVIILEVVGSFTADIFLSFEEEICGIMTNYFRDLKSLLEFVKIRKL